MNSIAFRCWKETKCLAQHTWLQVLRRKTMFSPVAQLACRGIEVEFQLFYFLLNSLSNYFVHFEGTFDGLASSITIGSTYTSSLGG